MIKVLAVNDDFSCLAVQSGDEFYWYFDDGDQRETTREAIISAITKGAFSRVLNGSKIVFGEDHYSLSHEGYAQI